MQSCPQIKGEQTISSTGGKMSSSSKRSRKLRALRKNVKIKIGAYIAQLIPQIIIAL